MDPESIPLGMAAKQFLNHYWQKKPLLIRAAFSDFASPLTPDELMDMAGEPMVDSRLVVEQANPDTPGSRWQLQYGPFTVDQFEQLPDSHWTLLVQDVEKHLPELEQILAAFRFVPNWRIDDLMISYAAPQGSVGPHVDAYDVFLLQGLGKRQWQISEQSVASDNFLPDCDLKILHEFKPHQQWTLEPGDMLYLPPGVAHFGIALEPCMTYSIGFRAPSHQELCQGIAESLLESMDPELRYQDPDLIPSQHAGLLRNQELERLEHIFRQTMAQPSQAIHHWIGKFLSESKADFGPETVHETLSMNQFQRRWTEQEYLYRTPGVRYLYRVSPQGHATLYVDGNDFPVPDDMIDGIDRLCAESVLHWDRWQDKLSNSACNDLLCTLYNRGYLYFEHD